MSYGRIPNGLPPRPVAGPSRPPAQTKPPQPQPQPHPPFNPHFGNYPPYPPTPPLPINPYQNATGGYPYPTSTPYQPYPTYGQSLFHQPSATPEGYSYSPTYLHNTYQPQPQPSSHAQNRPAPPPNKRPRPNYPTSNIAVLPSSSSSSSKAWRNCSYPGCKFVGAGEEVEIHEGDRHLIFPAGHAVEKSEEEERFAKINGPAPTIQGTGIRLETEEDISKWIEERRSKWPTQQRLAEKEEDKRAAIARGEMPGRGGRGRGRGGAFGRRNDPASQAEDWGRQVPLDTAAGTWNNNGEAQRGGRGRGRGRGGGRGRGREGDDMGGRGGFRDRDDLGGRSGFRENTQPVVEAVLPEVNKLAASPKIKPAVALGLGDYDSTTESTSNGDIDEHAHIDEKEDVEEKNDGDAGGGSDIVEVPKAQAVDHRPVCKFFAKSGKCRLGEKCRFAHTIHDKPVNSHESHNPDGRRKIPRQPPPKKANVFARPSMLGALLANPIQNTLSQLSQTIRFLVANDMLQDVELRPGEAEERERERNKVVVVDTSESVNQHSEEIQ
ncbi:hypothetical protein BCR39DRAFT_199676 [Naematelia encephala]|uniref:C3H1-type domain-containing protein n=1 Tax=Naematelia encephala TaxID=71784 RepID=A0A1Y2B236_9TREE|nr:hypothetical protein BCR39DRAFT_199676 [Naematelia encephala]